MRKRMEKKDRLQCPYQDSNLGRRGFAFPQHDDLTTNLYGPESEGKIAVMTAKFIEDNGCSGSNAFVL
jgi:hypothetical protein